MKLSKALLVAMVLAYWMTPCPAALSPDNVYLSESWREVLETATTAPAGACDSTADCGKAVSKACNALGRLRAKAPVTITRFGLRTAVGVCSGQCAGTTAIVQLIC